jgi:non-ribosomal peptide synthetase component F
MGMTSDNASTAVSDVHCAHELFEETARSYANCVAVRFRDLSLTYTELDRESNKLAEVLRSQGVGPECTVALFLDRSVEMIIGLLGILKSGAAYLPLDPTHPFERLKLIASDAALTALVTRTTLPHQFCDEHIPRAFVGGSDSGSSSGGSVRRAESHNLAYVIYTSGSTAKPKGVEVTHRSLLNVLQPMRREPGFSPEGILLAVTTLAFDIAALEMFLPLICGGQLVIAPEDACSNPEELARLLEASGATVMQATPATWHLLLEAGWTGQSGLTAFCGGGPQPRTRKAPG